MILIRKRRTTANDELFSSQAEQQSRHRAFFAALHVIGWPVAFAFYKAMSVDLRIWKDESPDSFFIKFIWVGISAVALTVYASLWCGWLAHEWLWRSSIPATWMAIALALIVDLTVFGWLLVGH